jgi:hypothetical protein
MASRKRTPDTSKLTRSKTIAYARKHKTGDAAGDDAGDDDADDVKPAAEKPTKLDQKFDKTELSQPIPPIASTDEPTRITDSVPATKPPEAPASSRDDRAQVETVAMPPLSDFGAPPDMPTVIVPPTSSAGAAEDPTNMPGPTSIPGGSPDDPAAPPGVVPPGDSRSLRRRADRYEFALIYRQTTFVITRTGTVGTRGAWRVVEYPTSAAAGTAYAKECSRFVSEGFTDYRG